MTDTDKQPCRPVKKLMDWKIVVDPYIPPWRRSEEEEYKEAVVWTKRFKAFLADHKSSEVQDVRVEPEYQNVCSVCGCLWEPTHFEALDDLPEYDGCAGCGAPLTETTER